MNPLPRILGMALFVVLAVLAALLAAPVWRATRSAPVAVAPDTTAMPPAPRDNATPVAVGAPPRAARMALLSQRLTLALALGGLVLSVILLFSLAFRSSQTNDSKAPFHTARTEITTLAKLAESSVAQGSELNRERDVRRRAEEDAELKQQLLTQSLEEKVRLGHDLHDGIIQSLYAAGLTLESARGLLQTNPAEADRRLQQCRASLNNSIREARGYISGLAPDNLRRGGFAQAFETLLSELGASHDTSFDVQVDEDATALLSPEQASETLQIAREAVSNALRHGRSSHITLRVHKGDREVCLLIQDNGTGFDAALRRDGGHGLGNMQARAESMGASLRVTSQPGEGTRVLATLPIRPSSAA